MCDTLKNDKCRILLIEKIRLKWITVHLRPNHVLDPGEWKILNVFPSEEPAGGKYHFRHEVPFIPTRKRYDKSKINESSSLLRVGMSGTSWRKCYFPPAGSSEGNTFRIFHSPKSKTWFGRKFTIYRRYVVCPDLCMTHTVWVKTELS